MKHILKNYRTGIEEIQYILFDKEMKHVETLNLTPQKATELVEKHNLQAISPLQAMKLNLL